MPIKRQVVLDDNGRWYKESISREEIEPVASLEAVFAKSQEIRLPNLIDIPEVGRVGAVLAFDAGTQVSSHWFTVHLQSIHFKCAWKTVTAKVEGEEDRVFMHPDFLKTSERLTIEWSVPLAFGATGVKAYPEIVLLCNINPWNGNYICNGAHLFAVHPNKNTYRMPLSNLYDTCAVCTGDYDSTSPMVMGCLEKVLHQFRNSPWNADLFKTENETSKFFRVRPNKEGFETMAIEGAWIDYCRKVASPISKYIL